MESSSSENASNWCSASSSKDFQRISMLSPLKVLNWFSYSSSWLMVLKKQWTYPANRCCTQIQQISTERNASKQPGNRSCRMAGRRNFLCSHEKVRSTWNRGALAAPIFSLHSFLNLRLNPFLFIASSSYPLLSITILFTFSPPFQSLMKLS